VPDISESRPAPEAVGAPSGEQIALKLGPNANVSKDEAPLEKEPAPSVSGGADMVTDELREKVRRALESEAYTWRTTRDISSELGVQESIIQSTLEKLIEEGIAVEADAPTPEGQGLYTTWSHYEKFTPRWKRLLKSVRDAVLWAFAASGSMRQ